LSCYQRERYSPEDSVPLSYIISLCGEANQEIIYEATALQQRFQQELKGRTVEVETQEDLFHVSHGAYPRYELGRPKSPITLKMEAKYSPKRWYLLEVHGVISHPLKALSSCNRSKKTALKTVFFGTIQYRSMGMLIKK
jgi:hypothetical protein